MDENYVFPRVDPKSCLTPTRSLLTAKIRAVKSVLDASRPKSPRTNHQEMMRIELLDEVRKILLKERKTKNLQTPKSDDVNNTN